MADNLYQLKTRAPIGSNVVINGPYDRFGRVIACQDNGFHLIRGIGNEKPRGIIYNTGD